MKLALFCLFIAVCAVSARTRQRWVTNERSIAHFQNDSMAGVEVEDFNNRFIIKKRKPVVPKKPVVDSKKDSNVDVDTDVNTDVSPDQDTEQRGLVDVIKKGVKGVKDIFKKDKLITTTQKPDKIDYESYFLKTSDFLKVENTRDSDMNEWNKPKWDWTQQKTNFRWTIFKGVMSAAGCDYPTHQPYKTATIEEWATCGPTCNEDPKCTHFSYANGDCKYYSGQGKREDADWSEDENQGFCGLSSVKKWKKEPNAITQNGCNFKDPSEKSVPLKKGSDCGKMCDDDFPNCTHFVANKRTCILKKGKPKKSESFMEALSDDNSTKCGILKKVCEGEDGC